MVKLFCRGMGVLRYWIICIISFDFLWRFKDQGLIIQYQYFVEKPIITINTV